MWVLKWILMAVVVIGVIGFAMQNTTQLVTVKFIQYETVALPLWVVMYASFTAGLLFWLIVSIAQIASLKNNLRKQRKEIKNLKHELDTLRNVSIDDSVIPQPSDTGKTTKENQTVEE
ncbi:LapA family protein [candidate division KSB1 bacterium]|nr:LapA family protein [candidate division KSB1 bacterium]